MIKMRKYIAIIMVMAIITVPSVAMAGFGLPRLGGSRSGGGGVA